MLMDPPEDTEGVEILQSIRLKKPNIAGVAAPTGELVRACRLHFSSPQAGWLHTGGVYVAFGTIFNGAWSACYGVAPSLGSSQQAKITAATEQAKIKDGAQLPRTAGRFLATMRDRDMRAKGFIEGEPRGLEIKRRQG